MEAGSDGEGYRNFNQSSSDGPKKSRRQMKTPFQLETLERTYALETYPSEATRAELSEKLGLTDRQLQMWFCHRRLKDKKEAAGMAAMRPRVPGLDGKRALESPKDELMVAEPGSEQGTGTGSGFGSGSGSGSGSRSSQFDNGDGVATVPIQYYESPRSVMERRVIACVEAQLGERLREDGPILGVEFDELPPGAFGAPIVNSEHRDRYTHLFDRFGPYQAKQISAASSDVRESPMLTIRSDGYGQIAPSYPYDSPAYIPHTKTLPFVQANDHPSGEYGIEGPVKSTGMVPQVSKQGHFSSHPNGAHDEEIVLVERKRKNDEASIGREMQAKEKRIQRELEKQDLLRRKMEEQVKKEMERQERERRKEEQRMMRELQRKEERFQREERRKIERREKFFQKELLRIERKRQKEEVRREKEAAKQKALMERATARRIAKESLELIEDERLELMELATSRRGLSSFLSLDYDTLQNLDLFRESLCEFPPRSVQLKKAFAIQPWSDSEVNVGNLLMAWKFCITFADVLGLWPFTLDEFVQALHDFDSRLLGEIHISLLKLLIKDIEDVARTPSGAPGTNQYSAVNPEGGHPQIVEGAYVWGFNIQNWQKHLTPLTWPEVLRQFALSAGFGPHLKKNGSGHLNEKDEAKGSEDVVSTLRSGSAAENAVAIMQEKGFPLQRRSRHRLTPGTVKFAAYHVLSLEGNKGLNVLELAEQIQKSGLRDLTTSKTPEASISVALSRDPVLFERIAPSTYCVRPAFQKDPADAEVVLASAREKIQRYLNFFLAGQTADEEERDDDSEEDAAEGAEIDDLGTPSSANRINDDQDQIGICIEKRKVNHPDGAFQNDKCDIVGKGISNSIHEHYATAIDESKSGEPWVQGLTEGDYSDLSVTERLSALVALIGVANEGNIIRVVLEDRLDAAIALKKQMSADAQLDKRRVKDELISKFHESSLLATVDGSPSPFVFSDNKNNEELVTGAVKDDPQIRAHNTQSYADNLYAEKSLAIQDTTMCQLTTPIQQSIYAAERSRLQLKSIVSHRAEEMYVYRSLPLGQDRRRNRYWQFVASVSSHDPGSGRIFVETPNDCWRLIDSEEAFDALLMSLDTRGIRESHLNMMLQKIEAQFKECVKKNFSRTKTASENIIKLGKEATERSSSSTSTADSESPSSGLYGTNSDKLESSSSFEIELGRNEKERENAFRRYQDFQIWMWKECLNSSSLCASTHGKKTMPLMGICWHCLDVYFYNEEICPSCRKPFGNADCFIEIDQKDFPNSSSSSLPLRVRLTKALLSFLEACVPAEALQPSWTEDCRKNWALRLHNSSTNDDLLQCLTQLEGIINRDYLSSNFETTKELLGYGASALSESGYPGSVPQLPWIPQTTAAVALRLLELDASISYDLRPKPQFRDDNVEFTKLTSRFASVQKVQRNELDQGPLKREDNWESLPNKTGNSRSKPSVRGRGRGSGGGRPRKRWQKGVIGSVSVSRRPKVKPSIKHRETLTQVLAQRGETYGQKHGRGRRTVRKRRTVKFIEPTPLYSLAQEDNIGSSAARPPRISSGAQLVDTEVDPRQANIDEYGNNFMEAIESGDSDLETPLEFKKWEAGQDVDPGRGTNLTETSDEDGDDSDDDNGYEEQDGDNMEVDQDQDMNYDDVERTGLNDEVRGSDSEEEYDEYSD